AALPKLALAQQLPFNPRQAEKWRSFEVTTRVEIVFPQGGTRVWLPIPSVDSGYQKALDNAWSGNAQTAKIVHDGTYGAGMLYAEWPTAEKNPVIELYSRFATRDRAVDFSARPESVERLSPGQRAFYTGSTEHLPTDCIVKRTAQDITKGARTAYDKAKAIYEWIVEKTQPPDLSDPLVQAVRPKLFGAWEMNWLAFNTANDIVLPNAKDGKLTFFMYPQAETAAGRVDSLDPDNFKYAMTAKELSA